MTTATRYQIPVLEPEATISTTPQWSADLAARLAAIYDGADLPATWQPGWSDYGADFVARFHTALAARRVFGSGLARTAGQHVIGAQPLTIARFEWASSLNPAHTVTGVTAVSSPSGLIRWQIVPGTGTDGPSLQIMRIVSDVTIGANGYVMLSGISWDY